MGAGPPLKKMGQNRANNNQHGYRCVDSMPKHWSVYTLIFSIASLLLFCFLFYDMRLSPSSVSLHSGRELGALKVEAGDSHLLSTALSSPIETITGDGDDSAFQENVLESDTLTSENTSLASSSEENPGSSENQEVSLSDEDLTMIKSAFDEESASSTPSQEEESPQEEDLLVEPDTDSKKLGVVEEKSSKESAQVSDVEAEEQVGLPVEVESFDLDTGPAEESLDDTTTVDEQMIATADKFAESEFEPSVDDTCDYSMGNWVYDENYPLYKPNTCPFVDGGFRCVENGRPSSEFQKWRWQPTACDLPRFDAKDMLERLRGSRLAFVGDSIGRNNWESMMCMLAEAVSNKSSIYEINGEPITKHTGFLSFLFEDYNCTVEYYRSPYLVPQGRAPPRSDPRVRSTLKLDLIDWSSSKWKGADIVIFNTGHWWSFGKLIRGGNYFQEGQKVYLNMTVGEAFRRGMLTVARFVERSMDPAKTQVFFRSYSPVHFKGGTWDHGGSCHDDSKPLQKFPFIYEDKTCNPMVAEVMEVNRKNPVNYLNVTYLSDLRPDGHSSIWQRVPSSPKNHQDCSHWCLPGVPDTWNEILFATLLNRGHGNWGNPKKLTS